MQWLETVSALVCSELEQAMAAHSAAYPDGDYRAANDRLGKAAIVADAVILAKGRWPNGKRFLCNKDRVRLLGETD